MSLKRRIFSIFAAIVMIFGSMPMPFLSAYAEDDLPAAGDVPRSLKKVTSNHDGTYDISLEIEGVSKEVNDAVKANVVVVFDTSGSMGYDAVTYNYTASNNGRYGLVNGDYLNLYKYTSYGWFGGDCELINNDWTSGTVYSDAGCRNRYNGTRYIRSVAENLGTRMQVAKDAVNGLANQLLAQNDPDSEDYKDVVEITLIDFATTSSLPRTPTTDLNTFKGWVNGLSVSTGDDAGTNWEDALDRANKVTFDNDGDKIYIIFVSDGDPTFRNSKFSNNANDCEWGWGRTCPPNPFGNGNNDNNSWNLGAAQVITASITAEGSNKELYTVGTFGDVHNMESLGGTYYNAVDQEALETAFASIVQKITKGLSVTDIKISDGITAATATEVSGTAGNFRYEVPEAWGSEPGVDFAAAQFNGTTVTWEPGQDKTLSTNETAKVTFTVWPSQAAMDCIAKIRNEENEAACDLGEGETLASYGLVKNGNKYELMTNSEATFTYRTRTDTNGTITVSAESDDQPFEERRDDTTLPETTLRVTKIWKDGMNAVQRDDIKDVKLDLYVDRTEDSEPVETFTFDKTQQTGNEWVGNRENGSYDYTVAPGVMKKLTGLPEAEAASLRAVALAAGEDRIVTVGTDEYAILEKGRDYEFEETYTLNANGSLHYEITKYKYHPMITKDGNIYDVTFNGDGTATIGSKPLTKLSAENTLNGGILVSKVVYNNDKIDRDIDDEYEITIYDIKDKDGNLLSGKFRIQNFEFVEDDEGNIVEQYVSAEPEESYQGGTLTKKIRINQKILVKDVPTGSTYSVRETLPSGYKENKYVYRVLQYNDENDEFSVIPNSHTVIGNGSAQATVENYLESGDLLITKTVTSTKQQYLANAQTKSFNFTVNIYDKEGTKVDTKSFSLKHGDDPYVIEDIPAGYRYEVIETPLAGFTAVGGATRSGTVAKGENNNHADFTNNYDMAPLTGDAAKIIVNKKFVEGREQFWLDSDEFIFIMTGNGENQESEPIKKIGDSGSYEFTVNITDAGTYRYHITEKERDEEGNSLFRDGVSRLGGDEDIDVEIVVVDNGDGTLRVTKKEYSKTSQTIFNTYEATSTFGEDETEGALVFEKVLEGRDWEDFDEFTFTIASQDENAPMPETTTITVKKSEDENFATFDFGVIEFDTDDIDQTYTYTITESFDEDVMKNVAQSEGTAGGISITVAVTDNEDGTLNLTVSSYDHVFTNIYTPDEVTTDDSELTENLFNVAKIVEDEEGRFNGEEFTFTIESDDFETRTLNVETKDEGIAEMDEPYVFSAAGTYTFTVTETAGENIEITYDDTTYTVVIEVVDNPEEGKLEIASATIDGEDVTESDGLVFTNVFSPRLKNVTIKKIWEQGNLLDLPAFITVEILANGVPERTVTIFPGEDNSWTQAIGDLYWYDEDGNEIEYTIREESIDGTKEGTFIAYEGDAILGQWTNEVKDYEITNTWTEATNEYEYDGEGETKFTIKKEDEKGNALAGVKFKVNGNKYTTDKNGKIVIEVPVEADENEDELTFTVKEVETLEGYEKVEGEAEITVTCTLELEADEDTLTNKYVKTCTFGKSGSEKFKWDETKLRLTVINNKVPEEEPVDPCADGGGCGGNVEPKPEPKPVLPVVTPDTGRLVRTSGGAAQDMTANFMIGRCIIFAAGLMLLFSTIKRKNAGLTK